MSRNSDIGRQSEALDQAERLGRRRREFQVEADDGDEAEEEDAPAEDQAADGQFFAEVLILSDFLKII